MKEHDSEVWQNPHQKTPHAVGKPAPNSAQNFPHPKSAPKSARWKTCGKIRFEDPRQNLHPKSSPELSTNTHRAPQREGRKGCHLSCTSLLLAQVFDNQKNDNQNPSCDPGGSPTARFSAVRNRCDGSFAFSASRQGRKSKHRWCS